MVVVKGGHEYASGVEESRRQLSPFAIVAGLGTILSVAVARLPESLLEQLRQQTPFRTSAAGSWFFRLLALFAVVQAFYGGFFVLRIERMEAARAGEPRFARKPKPAQVSLMARTAAGMVFLTLVYGLATVGLTAGRGGYWLFLVVAVLQGAWYLRLTGDVARWLDLQVDAPEPVHQDHPLDRASAPASPAVARGLTPRAHD